MHIARALSFFVVAAALALPGVAHAQCDPVACAAMDSHTACNTSVFSCVDVTGMGTLVCLPLMQSLPPVGTACETDDNACTADTCGGTTGQTSGDGLCHHTALADGTGCGANSICTGGTCGCAAGFVACGTTCIAPDACCTDADCGSFTDDTQHLHGACTSGTCVAACNDAYHSCQGICIPQAACCTSADCTKPPDGCHVPLGLCESGACTYAFADGAPCNADSDACTPNDTCHAGACVADTAHTVVCVQKDCRSIPACNKTTGNCVDIALADGALCGNNGCAPATGTCTGSVCSVGPQSCATLDTVCTVGQCNAAAPAGAPCASENRPNGSACSTTNKCILAPACSGGVCTGAEKSCAASGPCRVAECDPSSGACEESVAPSGTACASDVCTQNAACDVNGTCDGDPMPDGTPCKAMGCSTASCSRGQCGCGLADGGVPPSDAGHTASMSKSGCDVGAGGGGPSAALLAISLVLLARRRRSARPTA